MTANVRWLSIWAHSVPWRSRTGSVVADVDQPGFVAEDHRVYPVSKAEFGEDAADVRLDGALGQVQHRGDLGVGQTASDQGEHLALAGGECGKALGVPRRAGGGGHEVLDQPAGDAGRGDRLAGGDLADGGEQVGGESVLEQEAAGPGAQAVEDVFVEVEGG